MDIFAFDPALYLSFLLTFIRVSLVVFLLPFFGGEACPPTVKAAMCLVFTMAIFPRLSVAATAMPTHPFELVIIIMGELLLGLVLGLAVQFVFAGIQTGGHVLSFQMGFTMISFADPLSGAAIGVTSHLLYMVAMLTFLALDGHLYLLKAFSETFTLIPPGQLFLGDRLLHKMIDLSGDMFLMAIKIAAPVLAALFLIELALALMARAAPQMNLLMIGMPIKIAVGFGFMGLLFTIMADHIQNFIVDMDPMLYNLVRVMRPLASGQ